MKTALPGNLVPDADFFQGGEGMIDYSPLWQTMAQKGITQYRLLQRGIDNKTLDALKKNKNITLLTLEKLCVILDCTPNDVVRFQADIPGE